MHGQDRPAFFDVGVGHGDLAVEATRAEERRIQHVGAVRRGQYDDVLVALEPIHLNQHLVEGLLALVVRATTPATGAALAPDSVDFINENDARGMLFGLLEKVAYAA